MKNMNNKYMIRLVLVATLVATGLSSCGIRSTYKAPEIDTNVYRDAANSDTTTIADIPWRDFFTDVYLQALVDEALNNNFDMQTAVTRIQQAEANLGMTKAAFFPSVSLVGTFQQDRNVLAYKDPVTNEITSTKTLGSRTETYSLGVAVSWEADIWGKMYKEKQGAWAQYYGAEAASNLVKTSLISNIATSYYSLMALDEQLKVMKESIKLMGETVETMQALKDAGTLNGAAVEQSKSALYSTELNVPTLEKSIRELENSICLMLGRQPGSISRSTLNTQNLPTDLRYGVPSQMLARRPDVKAAEWAFRGAFEATGVAQAMFYPSVSISGTIGFGGIDGVNDFFSAEHLVTRLVGSLTQPIFAKKQLSANLKIKKAQQEAALIDFKKSVLSAGNEVSNYLYAYQKAMSKNEIRERQVKAVETSVYFTQELLKAGDANYTEVLTAEQNLLQAQLGQVSDRLEQLQATVNLYRALGGGVE